jgi:5,10-methylenetetrahydromethanopterin reductase
MKFGFAIIPYWPISETVELIQFAEDLGYDFAWMTDQTFFEDPFPTLAVAGDRTSIINLGVGVTNPYTRQPVQVARAIGTIGNLIQRSVALGIGAGNRRELLTPLGIEQTAPATRIREMIDLTRALLRGERVSFESRYTFMKEVKLQFDVTQSVPMYLAARGPGTLHLGGEIADGVIIGDLISDSGLEYAINEIELGRLKAGRTQDEIERVVWVATFISSDNESELIDRLRPWVAHHMAASPSVVQNALGMDDDRIADIRSAYAIGGPDEAAKHVTDEEVDKLALVGSPEKILAAMSRFRRWDIGQFVSLLYSRDLMENRETLRRFATDVMRHIER